MPARFDKKFVLFYIPPCNEWYVHSHKLYDTRLDAELAAQKFLPRGSLIAVQEISGMELDNVTDIV